MQILLQIFRPKIRDIRMWIHVHIPLRPNRWIFKPRGGMWQGITALSLTLYSLSLTLSLSLSLSLLFIHLLSFLLKLLFIFLCFCLFFSFTDSFQVCFLPIYLSFFLKLFLFLSFSLSLSLSLFHSLSLSLSLSLVLLCASTCLFAMIYDDTSFFLFVSLSKYFLFYSSDDFTNFSISQNVYVLGAILTSFFLRQILKFFVTFRWIWEPITHRKCVIYNSGIINL